MEDQNLRACDKVYVVSKRGKPLMPCSPYKAKRLLQQGKAIVKARTPFTIQLTIGTGETTQPVVNDIKAFKVKWRSSVSIVFAEKARKARYAAYLAIREAGWKITMREIIVERTDEFVFTKTADGQEPVIGMCYAPAYLAFLLGM